MNKLIRLYFLWVAVASALSAVGTVLLIYPSVKELTSGTWYYVIGVLLVVAGIALMVMQVRKLSQMWKALDRKN